MIKLNEMSNCELCGAPMPEGEEMFKVHGYSGACPKPSLEGPFQRAFDRADKLERDLQEAQEKIEGLQRSIWLVLRATSIGRPLCIPPTDVADFNPNKAVLESWTEPNGEHCFRASLSSP
jgi:hypothetical protein